MNWFGKSYRKTHVIYVSPDWIPDKGEKFNARDFVLKLTNAGIDCVELYTKDHHGISYYNTRIGKNYGRDILGELIKEAHRVSIKVIAYYSIAWDKYAGEKNPSWCGRNSKGEISASGDLVLGVCINSPYKDYVLGQLEEISANYEIDGIFLDIFGEFYCYCDNCKAKFEEMFGEEIPIDKTIKTNLVKLSQFSTRCRVDFLKELVSLVKNYRPNALITFNGVGDKVNPKLGQSTQELVELVDFLSCEGHGQHHKPQSLMARVMRGQGKPFEVTTPGSLPSWVGWNLKPSNLLYLESALVLANGGSYTIGINPYPSGRIEPKEMDNLGKVYQRIKKKEEYVVNSKSVSDIAILWTDETLGNDVIEGIYGALVESHFQFDIIGDKTKFNKYKLLILPDYISLSEKAVSKIKDYVRQGGSILSIYQASLLNKYGSLKENFALSEVFGASFVGFTPFTANYTKIEDSSLKKDILDVPILVETPAIETELTTGKKLASIVYPLKERTSQHYIWATAYNPPDEKSPYSMVTVNEYGNGRSIYIASAIGEDIGKMGEYRPWAKQLLINAVNMLLPDKLLVTNAPAGVEIVMNEQPERYIIHLVNTYPATAGKYSLNEKTLLTIQGIEIKLNFNRIGEVEGVYSVSGKKGVEYAVGDSWLKIKVPTFKIHTMLIVNKGNCGRKKLKSTQ